MKDEYVLTGEIRQPNQAETAIVAQFLDVTPCDTI